MAPNNNKAKLFEILRYGVLFGFYLKKKIGNILFLKLNDEYEFVFFNSLYIWGLSELYCNIILKIEKKLKKFFWLHWVFVAAHRLL